MRLQLLIAFITLSSLFAKRGVAQIVTNNPATLVDTNLVACKLLIEQLDAGGNHGLPPICFVKITNYSTNSKVWGLRLPLEKLLAIKLTDASGRLVEKTDYGMKFGRPLTQQHLNDWIIPIRMSGHLSAAWFQIPPGTFGEQVGVFSIPKAFKLTQPGQYTLHVRMRLIQSHFSDPSGTITQTNIFGGQYMGSGRTSPTVFQFVWLPETNTEIKIPPKDIKGS